MKKHRIFVLFAGLMLISEGLHALGLGDIEVRSYLGQPISARIQLISSSPQELATVTAGMAAASDYEFVGMRQSLSVPIRFVVDDDPDRPGIEVSSRLPVRDPVVQFVVEVSWSGGRMLKEYTVFLDPPTIASRAPAPAVFTRKEPEVAEYPDPEQLDMVETIKPEPRREPAPVAQTESPSTAQAESKVVEEQPADEPVVIESPEPEPAPVKPAVTVPFDKLAEEEPAVGQAVAGQELPAAEMQQQGPDGGELQPSEAMAATVDDISAVSDESGPEPAIETPTITEPAQGELDSEPQSTAQSTPRARPQTRSTNSAGQASSATTTASGENYGPVQRGDTLWSIASRHTRGSDYSINQAMLAIQRLNPDAFGANNINSLKAGVVLRMPAAAETSRLSERQAMIEAMRQERAYAAMRAGLPVEEVPALLTDLELPPEAPDTLDSDPVTAAAEPVDDGRLELVPPSEGQGQTAGGDGSNASTGAISSEELSETLARTEEELVNAQQENEYLAQRIRELEAQLVESGGTVESNDMAEMESSLREDRLAGDEQPVAVVKQPDADAWYQGKIAWFIGAALILVAFVVWLLRRLTASSGADTTGPGGNGPSTVVKMRTEAEEILETLDGEAEIDEPVDRDDKNVDAGEHDEPGEQAANPPRFAARPEEDSEVIELDTSDPETRLDLARAYISMNDPESARQMLEEVLETGNEDQVREAHAMMQELNS